MSKNQDFTGQANGQGDDQSQVISATKKLVGPLKKHERQIGTDHVLHTMCKVYEAHNTENQRQASRNQEQ